MTNHGETTGSFENGDMARHAGIEHHAFAGPADTHHVTLRTPAELADALPYLLGYRPEDSIVLAALHDQGGRGRFGGRARLGIPAAPDDWASAARQLAHGLVTGSERRGRRPAQMVAYLCQEPGQGESGRQVMERLRPLAQRIRVECGLLDAPVVEALCVSGGRLWSYCCTGEACCPAEGIAMGLPGTSVLAAAATYAGLQVRGTLRELRARLLPRETAAALDQEAALDCAGRKLVPRILDDTSRAQVAEETMALARQVMRRYVEAPAVSGTLMADARDDELLEHTEAAVLILGLQDRTTRDWAAAWMEGDEAGPALRLWRALARRCVGSYGEHAAAPLTLAGWVAWSAGDELEAREALAMALGADSEYLFARLLHQACNEGLDPESVRRCLRAERLERERRGRPAFEQAERPVEAEQAIEAGRAETDALASDGTTEPVADDAAAPASGSVASPATALAPTTAEGSRRRRRARRAGTAEDRSGTTASGHTRPPGTGTRKAVGRRRAAGDAGGVRLGRGDTEGEA
ncbi:DUF4192 domain-containing protein [Streptomyces adustus]|uniref:DUF4192 domain-containing protein n=1 Tax=Streptomyces adustus TaxID=1609272 RepID=A0A5N8VLV5_9ACTN|nr:DUF4192 domain-containing protein [Streptomyces adustus]MPY36247.1 DUF4192 domain-containing protein [Streptomyces adustus]